MNLIEAAKKTLQKSKEKENSHDPEPKEISVSGSGGKTADVNPEATIQMESNLDGIRR